jgi:hypothetical protein
MGRKVSLLWYTRKYSRRSTYLEVAQRIAGQAFSAERRSRVARASAKAATRPPGHSFILGWDGLCSVPFFSLRSKPGMISRTARRPSLPEFQSDINSQTEGSAGCFMHNLTVPRKRRLYAAGW